MLKIRKNIFETNSSSTHSICICSEEEYADWIKGKLLYDRDFNRLMKIEALPEHADLDDYQSFDDFCNDDYLETYEKRYTTKSGDKIVIFGKYGYDG